MAEVSTLIFFVNGRKVTINNPDPEMTLLYFLRYKLRLTGTKSGCGEGGCGACTVLYSRYDSFQDVIYHYAVNSCLAPLCSVHGIAVTTVEGLGSVRTKLHPVQSQIAESHGSQCGFCTPGIVMSTYALLMNHSQPSQQQLLEAFDGNLCRCTGYRPILEGLYHFTKEKSCPLKEKCCKNRLAQCEGDIEDLTAGPGPDGSDVHLECEEEEFKPLYDPSQEPIFPPELKLMSRHLIQQSLRFESPRCVWLRPTSLEELLDIKKKQPDCKLVTGNTEIGIEIKFKQRHWKVLVSPAFVRELRKVETTARGLRFGASVTLNKMERFLRKAVEEYPEEKTRVFKAFLEMLSCFAGQQIRNMASLGGNIINASPISDLNPLLMACNAELEFAAKEHNGFRQVKMDDNFFRGYRKTRLRDYEILAYVTLPFSHENEFCFGYKQANRKDDDIAIVNAGMWVQLGGPCGTLVQDICLAFGGVAVSTVRATGTMAELKGRKWDADLLSLVCSQDMLPHDLPLPPGVPGGMIAYRRTLTLSFFFKFYLAVAHRLEQQTLTETPGLPAEEVSGSTPLVRTPGHGCQFYTIEHSEHFAQDTIGKPIVHRAAHKQCTGEAVYLDDIPATHGELYLGLVTSARSHARLVCVDLRPALDMPGVLDVVDYKDVPGENTWDLLEKVFAKDKVVHEGQVIAAVIAETQIEAQRAAHSVIVTYEDLEPIVTIQDAIRHNSFHPCDLKVDRGDVSVAWELCDQVIQGQMQVSGQEHFYLEPHGCIVYPRDGGELEVMATTQSPTQMQKTLMKVLNYTANQISVKVKRLGGGFGGKETRNATVLLPSAVAAVKTNRPIRCVLDRDQDMCLTGTRHPAYATYKIGFNNDGKVIALEADLYLNMGHSLDLSFAVLETALLEIDTAYNIEHFRVKGHLCHTNLTSCTAFRGFGGPQAIIVAESWMGHVADTLGMDPERVREMNFYHDGDHTPCGQVVRMCNLTRCWNECIKNSDFYNRKQKVEEYNKANRWKKRGICVTPLKYGLAFLLQSMNQGGALVHVYTDGTVLVAHGGVEMGQGLHTKLIQVASRELSVPVSHVHISETSTSTVPNTGPTAASMSSDLYGAAVLDACNQLNERLAPHKAAQPDKTLREWAHSAHQSKVQLSAVGFFRLDNVNLDWSRKVNSPFSYFSFGAACSEVEIDCLTGDHVVLRTDIVMDVGKSLNPGIDVGQIEGAFLQGYGLVALEDYKVSPKGIHLSRGPGTYKIPTFGNIPQTMNVALLSSSRNPRAIYSSKGVGEPPLCLATSVLLALKAAISACRLDSGQPRHFQLDTPATPDKIRMACQDSLARMFDEDDDKDKQNPWNVKL